MQKTSQKCKEWRRYKEVSVPWAQYDAYRLSECKRILDLKKLFTELDKPVQRREFKLFKHGDSSHVEDNVWHII